MSINIENRLDEGPFDMEAAVKRNRERLAERFEEARLTGHAYLVECRDLGDAFAPDAGVYFIDCRDVSEVDHVAMELSDDNPFERMVGVFDLSKPLDAQGGGLSRGEWLTSRH